MKNFKLTTNFHNHTFRCRHADGSDEEYVIAAIKAGFVELGFSDHQEITVDNFYLNNIGKETLNDYLSSINSLKEKYKDKIEIHVGLESLYLPGMERQLKQLKKQGIEYLILGQHDILDENNNRYYILRKVYDANRDFIGDEEIKQYTSLLCKGIKTRLYSYVAHPDLFLCAVDHISKTALDCLRKICVTAKKYDIPLEINLSGYKRNLKYRYPSEEMFKIAGELGNKVIIGIDAHSPIAYTNFELEKALEMIDKYHLNLIKTIF